MRVQDYFEDLEWDFDSVRSPTGPTPSLRQMLEGQDDTTKDGGTIMRRKRLILAAVRVWELKRGAKE